MVAWKPVAAIPVLFHQINDKWPTRDKATDGVIGDAAHQSRISDHNPDSHGWVHAMDIDKDLDAHDANAAEKLANELLTYARTKQPGSERLKNIVYRDRVASGTYPNEYWTWRPGTYGHFDHIHISFTTGTELDARPFPLPIFGAPVAPPVHIAVPTEPGEEMLAIVTLNNSTTYWIISSGKTVSVPQATGLSWTGPKLTITDAATWSAFRAAYPTV
jgi:hypothetical protein